MFSQSAQLPYLFHFLVNWFNRLLPYPNAVFFGSAFLIGGGTGLTLALFHYLIKLFENLAFGQLMGHLSVWGYWVVVFPPLLGGVLVALLTLFVPGFNSHSCINQPTGTQVAVKPALTKFLAATISLGTGASLGPEGPSVEIGGNIGLFLGQLLKVSQKRSRLLLSAGAAAGLAAGFNAPIAGVFFALEKVLGTTFTTPAASIILLAAVVAGITSRILLGEHPAFTLPVYEVNHQWEIFFYLGLGLLCGLVSLVHSQSIKLAQAAFQGNLKPLSWLGLIPTEFKPIVGGLVMGITALALPQVLGIGYGTLTLILQGSDLSPSFLSILLIVKLLLTAICLGSGLVGGIFAPTMFIGACLGAIYGQIVVHLVPLGLVEMAPPAAYAMVGMAALLASTVKAPLTSIILMFELTQNYLVILPLMAAVGVSIWIGELFKAENSQKTLNFQEMGINLEEAKELEVLEKVTVAQIMERSYLHFPEYYPLIEAGQIMVDQKTHTALILQTDGELMGIMTLGDVKRQLLGTTVDQQGITLREICNREVVFAYPEERVSDVLKRMITRDYSLLPVVDPQQPKVVLGVVDRQIINLATDLSLTAAALNNCQVQAKVNSN